MRRDLLARTYVSFQDRLSAGAAALLFDAAETAHDRILVYRTARLGDFIATLPALAAIRRAFPRARIALMTASSSRADIAGVTRRQGGADALPWTRFACPGLVDEVRVLDFARRSRAVEEARRVVADLEPDAAFILPFSGEGAWSRLKKMAFLRAAGFSRTLYGVRVHSALGAMRRAQFRAGLVAHEAWGPLRAAMECPAVAPVRAEDVRFTIVPGPAAETAADAVLAGLGWSRERLAVVLPGGSFPHKRWPRGRFVELCRRLEASRGLRFLVIGSRDEADVCGAVAAALGPERAADLSGRLEIDAVAALMRRSILFIGNDSGPAHLAAAAGCAGVVFFSGIVFPGLWEPWGGRLRPLRERVPCEFCFADTECPTGTRACMDAITVERAHAECAEILSEDGLRT